MGSTIVAVLVNWNLLPYKYDIVHITHTLKFHKMYTFKINFTDIPQNWEI